MIITMRDVRASKMCAKGARTFFSRHSLDWRAFLDVGIDSAVLENTKDEMAIRVVREAHARRRG
jgi:hypothetical protein